MKNKITIQDAREIVAKLDFPASPVDWKLDMEKVAKAYKSYANQTDHETAIQFIFYYLHRYRVLNFVVIDADKTI